MTLLNRILNKNHGECYAIIVNKFGVTDVDNYLIVDNGRRNTENE
ncbi:GTP-binding protein [Bartonella sp. CB169]